MAGADKVIVCSLPLAKNALHSPTRNIRQLPFHTNSSKFMHVEWARPGMTCILTELGTMTIEIRSIL